MKIHTFAQMLVLAQENGITVGTHEGQPIERYNQFVGVTAYQETLLHASQPSLDDEFEGVTVYPSVVTCWVVTPEEGAVPLSIFAGYSEFQTKVHSYDQTWVLGETQEFPEDLWELLQRSRWTSPE